MKWVSILGCMALLCAPFDAANATPRAYNYVVSHPLYGTIGTYDRIVDETGGDIRARSRLAITVTLLGFVVHTETADQTELWHGTKLMSFQSVTTVNGRPIAVHGEARENHFVITSPTRTVVAPADIVASDPWSLNRIGPGIVVSIKSGDISPVEVIGGEADTVTLLGVREPAHHFHVNTPTQPNKWEVWFDQRGVPIKFSTFESIGAVDFTLVSPPQAGEGANSMGW